MPNPYAGFSHELLLSVLKELRWEVERRASQRGEPRRRSAYAQAAQALAEAESYLAEAT